MSVTGPSGTRKSDIAALLHGQLRGADAVISSISTDSRNLRAGDLFIALQGPNFDGNDYLAAARERGAAAAVVSRAQDDTLPQIVVADTRLALGRIAR